MLFHAGKVREIQFSGRKLGGGDYYTGEGKRNRTVGVKVGVFGGADALTFSSNGSRLNSSTWSAVREFLAFSEFCFVLKWKTSTLILTKCMYLTNWNECSLCKQHLRSLNIPHKCWIEQIQTVTFGNKHYLSRGYLPYSILASNKLCSAFFKRTMDFVPRLLQWNHVRKSFLYRQYG